MPNVTSKSDSLKDRRSPADPPRVNVISFLLLVACIAPAVAIAVAWNKPAVLPVGSCWA